MDIGSNLWERRGHCQVRDWIWDSSCESKFSCEIIRIITIFKLQLIYVFGISHLLTVTWNVPSLLVLLLSCIQAFMIAIKHLNIIDPRCTNQSFIIISIIRNSFPLPDHRSVLAWVWSILVVHIVMSQYHIWHLIPASGTFNSYPCTQDKLLTMINGMDLSCVSVGFLYDLRFCSFYLIVPPYLLLICWSCWPLDIVWDVSFIVQKAEGPIGVQMGITLKM